MAHWFAIALAVLLSSNVLANETTSQDLIETLGFEAAAAALSRDQVAELLAGHGKTLGAKAQNSAALLVAMGLIPAAALDTPTLATRLSSWRRAYEHADFQGALGEHALIDRLAEPWDHTDLLAEADLLEVLGDALAKGVLTGYDLRRKDVYAGFPSGHTFIYSHSSAQHLQQLATMLAASGVTARMYVAPKVSAFLFRDDWGSPGANVRTLPSGTRVLNGREAAVLFEFDTPAGRQAFHEVVQRYAKRDAKDEAGLIADAWWQPFYYTDQPFADFKPIALVIVASPTHEATLTVVPEREQLVVEALSGRGFPVRVDRVWVNPAFFRFLNGGFR